MSARDTVQCYSGIDWMKNYNVSVNFVSPQLLYNK